MLNGRKPKKPKMGASEKEPSKSDEAVKNKEKVKENPRQTIK